MSDCPCPKHPFDCDGHPHKCGCSDVTIPEHIQKEARDVARKVIFECGGDLNSVELQVATNTLSIALLAAEERGAARERERCVGIVESGSNAALRLLEVNDPDEAEVRIVSFVLSKACTQLANKIRGNSA